MEFQRKSKEKRFGLSYMGSKSRFWRWLSRRIPSCETFYDLFAGGCSVGHMMGHFGKCEKVVFNDVNAMPLRLFEMAINGTLPPPAWMSSEEFRERNRADDPLSLLFTFGSKGRSFFCSKAVEPWQKELFHAKISGDYSFFADILGIDDFCGLSWAWSRKHSDLLNEAAKSFAPEGVAWSDKSYVTLCRSYPFERRERLSRFDELPLNLPIEFRNTDYRAAAEDAGEDDVIYADPPYDSKTGYGVAFDNVEFWEWCRRPRRALLIISEYSAPSDFVEIWAKKVTCAMSQKGVVGRPIERLFVHKSQEELYWDMYGMPLLPLKFGDQHEEWRNSNTSRLFLSNFANKNK